MRNAECGECGEKNISPHFLQKFTAFSFQRLFKFTRNRIEVSYKNQYGIMAVMATMVGSRPTKFY